MKISLPHKYWTRLFTGIMAAIFLLGYGFSTTVSAVLVSPQAGEDSGTETPTPPKPKPPAPPSPI
jgi:hypothetical protein